ncbi:MAG TPA: hypothetical protein VFC23_19005, partial [Thermoanaerobaculia bacterium]|nr:hypothetical protein [Thermoanaerobaculia bacterium]
DDFRPYLYRTSDYGATWTRIDSGIDPSHFTRVVRADPARRGLLYAGTERGAYVSFDDGARWQPLQLNLPVVPVADLTIKDGDLVAATQGRGFWVLDDLQPLRDVAARAGNAASPGPGGAKAYLYPVAPVTRLPSAFGFGGRSGQGMGTNPPAGAVIDYYLKEAPPEAQAKKVKLEILAADGKVVQTFQGKPAEDGKDAKDGKGAKDKTKKDQPAQKPRAGEAQAQEKAPPAAAKEAEANQDKGKEAEKEEKDEAGPGEEEQPKVPTEAGHNRFVWDLRWPAAAKFPGMVLWSGDPVEPMALPGRYQVRLTAAGETLTEAFEIRKDPRSTSTQGDLEAQSRFLQEIRDKLTETHDAIRRIRDVRAQLKEVEKRLAKDEAQKPVVAAAKEIDKKMTEVEETLYQTKNRSSEDPLNFPIKLDDKLNSVADSASLGDYRPTAQAVAVKNQITAEIDAQLARLRRIWETDLVRFNDLAKEKSVPAVILPPARLK